MPAIAAPGPHAQDNGVLAFCVTMALQASLLASGRLPPALLYEQLPQLAATAAAGACCACALLYVKGRLAPCGQDSGSSGSLVHDLYWGLELHPRVLGLVRPLPPPLRLAPLGPARGCPFSEAHSPP